MASTYSNLKIQLMATGENNTTWGDVTNLNLGTALEEAIVGSADVAFSNANVTLTLTDTNASQTARNMRLNLTGTATAGYNLVVPAIEKPYIINNGTDGTITVKNSTGTGIAVPAGKTMWVYNDGTNVVDAVTRLSSLTLGTALAVGSGGTGANTFTSNGVLLGNGTSAISATAAGTTGQVLVGNTGSAPSWATLSGIGVTSFSAGTTGFTPSTGTTGAVTLAGTLNVANGGTGATSLTSGYLVKGNGTSAASASVVYDDGTNVGIGTSLPGAKLDVSGTIWARASSAAIGMDVLGRSADNGGQIRFLNNAATTALATVATYGNDFALLNNTASYSLLLGTNNTERMRIDSTGNVGIGTSSPVSKCDVYASSGYVDSRVRSGTTQTFLGADSGSAYIGTYSNNPLLISTNNTERMRIDSSGNVGIGTSAPQGKLDVQSRSSGVVTAGLVLDNQVASSVGTGIDLRFYVNDGGAARYAAVRSVQATSGDYADLRFLTANSDAPTERMRIDSSGNVGIGGTPGARLDVFGGIRSNGVSVGKATLEPGAATNSGYTGYYNAAGTRVGYVGFANDASGVFIINSEVATNAMTFSTANTERMRIDSSGNVGIGTTSPGTKLDVVGIIRTSSEIRMSDAQVMRWGTSDSATIQAQSGASAGYMIFGVNGERMRITSGGDLLVGTTSNLGATTASEFKETTSTVWPLCLNAVDRGVLVRNSATSGYYAYFEYNNGPNNNGSISYSGGTTAFNTTSDARIKTNIANAPDAGSLIDDIQVRSWDFKADGSHWRYGMVAQELLEVAPEAVHVPEDEEDMMGVDYSKLVPMLIKEVQSLRARVAQLEGN